MAVTGTGTVTADALVVVDVQRAPVEGPRAVCEADVLPARLEAALSGARVAGALVVHLQDDGDDPGSLISKGSTGLEPVLTVAEGEPVNGECHRRRLRRRRPGAPAGACDRQPPVPGADPVGAVRRGHGPRCRGPGPGPTVMLSRDDHTTYDVPADRRRPGRCPGGPGVADRRALGNAVGGPDG